jgi:hypothetical protein
MMDIVESTFELVSLPAESIFGPVSGLRCLFVDDDEKQFPRGVRFVVLERLVRRSWNVIVMAPDGFVNIACSNRFRIVRMNTENSEEFSAMITKGRR